MQEQRAAKVGAISAFALLLHDLKKRKENLATLNSISAGVDRACAML